MTDRDTEHKTCPPIARAVQVLGELLRAALKANYPEDTPVFALVISEPKDAGESFLAGISSNAPDVNVVRGLLTAALYATYRTPETEIEDEDGEDPEDESIADLFATAGRMQ